MVYHSIFNYKKNNTTKSEFYKFIVYTNLGPT